MPKLTKEELQTIIREELDALLKETTSTEKVSDKDGVTTHRLKDGEKATGWMKTKKTDKGQVMVGLVGKKAAEKPLGEAAPPEPAVGKKKKKKDEKSIEQKSREMGQIEMFPLKEWIEIIESAKLKFKKL